MLNKHLPIHQEKNMISKSEIYMEIRELMNSGKAEEINICVFRYKLNKGASSGILCAQKLSYPPDCELPKCP